MQRYPKSETVRVRVTPRTLRAMKKAAGKEQLSVGEWLRNLIHNQLDSATVATTGRSGAAVRPRGA